jgi:uracil-DNA glycosylase
MSDALFANLQFMMPLYPAARQPRMRHPFKKNEKNVVIPPPPLSTTNIQTKDKQKWNFEEDIKNAKQKLKQISSPSTQD